jgi:hypothetical protein
VGGVIIADGSPEVEMEWDNCPKTRRSVSSDLEDPSPRPILIAMRVRWIEPFGLLSWALLHRVLSK